MLCILAYKLHPCTQRKLLTARVTMSNQKHDCSDVIVLQQAACTIHVAVAAKDVHAHVDVPVQILIGLLKFGLTLTLVPRADSCCKSTLAFWTRF